MSWALFSKIATLFGFAKDVYDAGNSLRRGNHRLPWLLAALFLLWLAAVYLLIARQPASLVDYLYLPSLIIAWSIPILLVLGLVVYLVWGLLPPKKTVVLVSRIVDQRGNDDRRVTQSLLDGLRETLSAHKGIHIKPLHRSIPADGGSKMARRIGHRPQHKASFVISGDYVAHPDPEVYVRFDLIKDSQTYLGSTWNERYGPTQVQQPDFYAFKLDLAEHLGHLIAFASALALDQAHRHQEAIPLYDTALAACDHPLGAEMTRAIRFHRGTNYLALGRAPDAEADLASLALPLEAPAEDWDILSHASLGNLGLVVMDQGRLPVAKAFFQRSLALHQEHDNRLGQAKQLGNLGLVAMQESAFADAKDFHQQALDVFKQLGNRLGQAQALGNLGLVAMDQGDLDVAKQHHLQALAIDRRLHNLLGKANDLNNLGLIARQQDYLDTAKNYHHRALKINTRLGRLLGTAESLNNLGLVAGEQDDQPSAKKYHLQALDIYERLDHPLGQANQLGNLGNIAKHQGDLEAAEDYHLQALDIDEKCGYRLGVAQDLANLGTLAIAAFTLSAARDYLQRSKALYEELGVPVPTVVSNALKWLDSQEAGD